VRCFFKDRPGWGPCDGPLIRAHLIAKQIIKREVFSVLAGEHGREKARKLLEPYVWDERGWVPCCGGPTGIGGHHGRLDARGTRLTTLRRHELPERVEEFARELDGLVGREVFGSWLDRTYGERTG
jgi:hypothetical protein